MPINKVSPPLSLPYLSAHLRATQLQITFEPSLDGTSDKTAAFGGSVHKIPNVKSEGLILFQVLTTKLVKFVLVDHPVF
jgi:hypothetical protein